MRTFVATILGLVLATAAVALLGTALGQRAYLAALLAGLLAGGAMRVLASGAGSMYLRGGLAAAATVLAAIAGPIASAQWYTSQSNSMGAATVSRDANQQQAEEPVAPGRSGQSATAIAASAMRDVVVSGGSAAGATSRPGNAVWELASMAIGCLLAYQLGKGSPARPAEEEADQSPQDEPDAE